MSWGALRVWNDGTIAPVTGIVHSECNLEPGTTRIFQIWIMPNRRRRAEKQRG